MENSPKVTISIIGAGHVAHHLACSFHEQEVKIQQVYNRSEANGKTLSDIVNAEYIKSIELLKPSNFLIIAVNDNAIKSISDSITKEVSNTSIIAHTSGSQSIKILERHSRYGGFYPLQSFRKSTPIDIATVPILISAENGKVESKLLELASLISTRAIAMTDSDRSLLHLPAVMINNFTNHLLQLAYDYCEQNNLDFSLLQPLLKKTIGRIQNHKTPKELQTGPAIRGDRSTIERHINQLEEYPEILNLYKMMTSNIEQYYK